jgi:hypothetical protein
LEVQVKRSISFAAADPVFRKVVSQIVKASQRPDFLTHRYELAIATTKGSRKIDGAYQDVLTLARQIGDAETFATQIDLAGVANDDMRAFVRTFKSHLRDEGSPDDNETVWLLLCRLQILTFDFTAPGSASHDLALERAVRVLHTDDGARAGAFWASLIELVIDVAKGGGDRTRETALQALVQQGYRFVGDHWRHLPHEAEVLFGVAARTAKSREPVVALIRKHLHRIEAMPARLALIAPESALEFVRQEKSIALAHFEHVEWRYGTFIIALFAEHAPQLLPSVVAQCIPTLAKTFAQPNSSWYKECAPMLQGMMEHCPNSLQLALDKVDVAGARVGWLAAWAEGNGSRKTVSILLGAAKSRSDPLGEFARQFKRSRRVKPQD